MEEYKKLAGEIVETGLSNGADTVEVSLIETVDFDVLVRKSRVENLTESISRRVAITLSVDKRRATLSSSDLSEESIRSLVMEGIELCSIMDRDEFFDLPDPDELGAAWENLEIFDENSLHVDPTKKIELATDVEKAALRLDGRIISDGGFFSSSVQKIVIANSMGFCEGYRRTLNSVGVSCAVDEIKKEGHNIGKKQSSYWYSTSIFFDRLDPVESIAEKAVERTIRKLGAVKPRTRKVPVVFDNITASEFLSYIASAVNGGRIYRKESFLVDMLDRRIASDQVTVIDDPLLPAKLGSRPFDSEGVRSRKNTVLEKGVLKTYLLSSYQARKLAMKTTGNSGGASNFYMVPGKHDPDEIISSVDEGLYLTFLSGPGANIVTGDFSRGAQGIWIRKGRLAEPVDEFTITGTFQEMLKNITMVANDIDWKRKITAPTMRIDEMTVSGL